MTHARRVPIGRACIRGVAVAVVAVLVVLQPAQLPASPEKDYTLTIAALKERLADELTAHGKSMAYARRACNEGYPNVAHLFKALAVSEGVHARNFRKLLAELAPGADAPGPVGRFEVNTTRGNLAVATAVELEEIDREYPAIIRRIRPEEHPHAIESINWAWKAEDQHRELIVKIGKAANRWFGLLVGRIEGGPSSYHVCQVCGSTLLELADDHCPICGHEAGSYQGVKPFPEKGCESRFKTDDEEDYL